MARHTLNDYTMNTPDFIYTPDGLVATPLSINTSGVSDGYDTGTVITTSGVQYSTTAIGSGSPETLASGDGATKVFQGFFAHSKIVPGSVEITATVSSSTVTISDDGKGALSASGVAGFIDYDSGYFYLSFDTAPDNATDITATYTYANGDVAGILLEDVPGGESSYSALVMVAGAVVGSKLNPAADNKIKADLGNVVFV